MIPIKFSLQMTRVPVTLVGDDGVEKSYVLQEMSAEARDIYLEQFSARMKLDATGKAVGVQKFRGLQGELLTHCLKTDDGKAVPIQEIQGWPTAVVGELFKKAQELNHLEKEKEEEPPKNG